MIANVPLSNAMHAHTGFAHEWDVQKMSAAIATKPLAITPPARNGTVRHRGGDNCGMKLKAIPCSGRERQKKMRVPRTENVKNGRPVPIPNELTMNPTARPMSAWPSSWTKIETYVMGMKSAATISGLSPLFDISST